MEKLLLDSLSTCLGMKPQRFAFMLRKHFIFNFKKEKSHIQFKVAITKFPYGLTLNQPQGNSYNSQVHPMKIHLAWF